MAQQDRSARDPWKELSKGTRQVDLNEVLTRLSVEERTAEALKKALIARVDRLTRTG